VNHSPTERERKGEREREIENICSCLGRYAATGNNTSEEKYSLQSDV
jgi:hypothetical protein